MKLLILTQQVNKKGDLLGFFHDWLSEFALQCEQVTVICLFEGEHSLPANVKVLSLGKERGRSRLKYILNFYKYIWRERKNYDAVFVHMNQIYVLLGGLFWKFWDKKISLWFAHKSVTWSLVLAEKIVDVIFTASSKSFRIPSGKLKIVGHGINTDNFQPPHGGEASDGPFTIVSVGRVSPIKDYELLLRAAKILVKDNKLFKLNIVGGPGLPEDMPYFDKLVKMAGEMKLSHLINFVGNLPNPEVRKYLQAADLFVNLSNTGSLDKAILEAMASGLPVLTCNEAAAKDVLMEFRDELIFNPGDSADLARKIGYMIGLGVQARREAGLRLRNIVVKDHNYKQLIKKILLNLDEASRQEKL